MDRSGESEMRYGLRSVQAFVAAVFVIGSAGVVRAQVARVSGFVKDAAGQPIKGATIRADNPDAALSTLTAATDDKGRFAIIGLARGGWSFTAEAPGFQAQFSELNIQRTGTPNPPLAFTLQKAVVRPPAGIEGVSAKDLQQQLSAADALYKEQKFEDAVGIYRTILTNAPSLSIVNLQIAAAYRNMKQYDKAIAAYNDLLKAEPENQKAIIGMAMTQVDKGDVPAAEQALTRAAEAPLPSRDVFYDLAEIKDARHLTEEAARLYQRAADADSSWGKPLFKLGTIAMSKGDKEGAAKAMSQVIAVDPTSPEAAQARTALEQLKR
jgi:tetratricopeptide (TPR) repeat protein